MMRILRVKGRSMEPAFKEGDFLIVLKSGNFKHGDAVVINHPKKGLIVKSVEFIESGGVFVTGENLKESTDSRQFGLVDTKDIVGRVWKVIK